MTDASTFAKVKQWANTRASVVYEEVKTRQKQKLAELLCNTKQPVNRGAQDEPTTVVNLSKRSISEHEEQVLALGLNYGLTPKEVPMDDLIASTEVLAKRLNGEDATELRRIVKCCATLPKPPSSNLTINQRRALASLKRDSSIIILRADKGNATVVLDSSTYDQKINEVLSDKSKYSPLNKDPTNKLERRLVKTLSQLHNQGELDHEYKRRLTPSQSHAPQLYGLPKVHKEGIPLRPIVSTIGSPHYALAKELARILAPLAGLSDSYIRNSGHFVQRLSMITITDQDLLVSFDVKSLFTQVPIDEALTIVADKIHDDDSLIERTTLSATSICQLVRECLRSTYFEYRQSYWEQTEGSPMGSPLSPIIANLYMEAFEQEAIRLAIDKPKIWFRYVDDTFVIWPHGLDKLEQFHNHLNRRNDSIKFTMETEKEHKLPFLDVMVIKDSLNNTLTTSVYRKDTHTNRYLHYNSHHHPRIKTGIISCLKHRAKTICSDSLVQQELNHLKDVFITNGYPPRVIQNTMTKQKSTMTTPPSDDPKPATLYLPYIKGVSEKIEKQVRPLNIRTVFRTSTTLGRHLTTVKSKIARDSIKGVVYQIPCKCGHVYIGETGRNLKLRLTEHKRAVKNKDPNNGLAVHVSITNHTILWQNAEVLTIEPNWSKRKVREALYIKRTKDTLNLDQGYTLDNVWRLSF